MCSTESQRIRAVGKVNRALEKKAGLNKVGIGVELGNDSCQNQVTHVSEHTHYRPHL